MNRLIKLIILIILSLSVYFIYQATEECNKKILNIGDGLSLGINSFGIKEYGYIDYYKDKIKDNKTITVNSTYAKKYLSISNLLEIIKTNPNIKKELTESHQLILHIGYNDLLYKLSLEEVKTNNGLNRIIKGIEKDYKKLIKEIRKYYKEEIIIIGYYKSQKEDYYLNQGIRKLNSILKDEENITYIDTYNLLEKRDKYFSNPNSYYPNRLGYQLIANKIIAKALEKS